MNMRKPVFLAVAMFLLQSIVVSAHSGNGAGNGGSGWVCRENDAALTVRWVRLLDTWEAEADPHRKYSYGARDYGSARQHVVAAVNALAGKVPGKFADDLALFEELIQNGRARSGVRVILPADATIKVFPGPETCAGGVLDREAIALYDRNEKLSVNDDLFQKLNATDQLGLALHEQLFARSRDFDEAETSDFAREVVADLLRATPTAIPEKTQSALTRWYAGPTRSSRILIEFDAYASMPLKDQIPFVEIDGERIRFPQKSCKQVSVLSEKKNLYRCKVTGPRVFVGFTITLVHGHSPFFIRLGKRIPVSSRVRVRATQGVFWIDEQFEIKEPDPTFGRAEIEIGDRLSVR